LARPADTIYAVSSGPGRAAVAVIRISGPHAGTALDRLSGRARARPREAALRRLRDPDSGEALDQSLTLWLPSPHSFTGDDMAELQVHGGRAVLAGVLGALARLPELRPAEPGEFARRAFDNGRLDLVEAEGLADLVAAETAAQRRQALRQMGGALGALYDGWRALVIETMALAEANLDFSDQDLPPGLDDAARRSVASLARAIAAHLDDRRRGELVRDGLEIAILGPPNAGKSSLMNLLAKRDVAIVSEEAGTTRDVIEVHHDLGGLPVIIADTAGIREAQGRVEQAGIERAKARVEAADILLWVVDATAPVWTPPPDICPRKSGQSGAMAAQITILNKIDLAQPVGSLDRIEVSAKTGEGIDCLIQAFKAKAVLAAGQGAGAPLLTRTRHRVELEGAYAALQRFGDPELSPELKAEELRIAARHLGRLTGRIDVEEVLGAIFAEFCIGK
jgi:tRNA modification GTPase